MRSLRRSLWTYLPLFHVERLLFLVSVILLPISVPGQSPPFLISTNVIPAGQAPRVFKDAEKRIWVSYYCAYDNTLRSGYLHKERWYEAPPSRLGTQPIAGTQIWSAMDVQGRFWCAYRDTQEVFRLELHGEGRGSYIGQVGSTGVTAVRTGLSGGSQAGVWVWNRDELAYGTENGILKRDTTDSVIGVATHVASSVVAAIWTSRYEMGNMTAREWHSSYAGFLLEGRFLHLAGSYLSWNRYSGSEGSFTCPIGIGGNGSRALFLNTYSADVKQPSRVDAYLIDEDVRRMWSGVFPSVPTNVAMSDCRGPQALCWLNAGTLFAKPLLGTVWIETDSTTLLGGDSWWDFPSVVVDDDTSLWVAYSAMTHADRQVFLTHWKVPLVPDRRLSPITIPVQPQIVDLTGSENLLPNRVSLRWTDDPLADLFHVQVFADSLLLGAVVDTFAVSSAGFIVGPLEPLRTYYWRVAGTNFDAQGPWLNVSRFTTRSIDPLVRLGPADGSIVISSHAVEFRWRRHPDVRRYRLRIYGTPETQSVQPDGQGWSGDTLSVVTALANSRVYSWRVDAELTDGSTITTDPWQFCTIDTVRINPVSAGLPEEFRIDRPYPNPFNSVVNFRIELPTPAMVQVVAFDILGREVGRIFDSWLPYGVFDIPWSPVGISSGMYVCWIGVRPPEHYSTGLISVERVMLLR